MSGPLAKTTPGQMGAAECRWGCGLPKAQCLTQNHQWTTTGERYSLQTAQPTERTSSALWKPASVGWGGGHTHKLCPSPT